MGGRALVLRSCHFDDVTSYIAGAEPRNVIAPRVRTQQACEDGKHAPLAWILLCTSTYISYPRAHGFGGVALRPDARDASVSAHDAHDTARYACDDCRTTMRRGTESSRLARRGPSVAGGTCGAIPAVRQRAAAADRHNSCPCQLRPFRTIEPVHTGASDNPWPLTPPRRDSVCSEPGPVYQRLRIGAARTTALAPAPLFLLFYFFAV